MTLNTAERLMTYMRANGVKYFKGLEVEIRLSDLPQSQPSPTEGISHGQSTDPQKTAAPIPSTGAAAPPVHMEIPHHVNEVQKLLRLGDNDLVDALFPEGSRPEGEQ